jgi:hypothetical protein
MDSQLPPQIQELLINQILSKIVPNIPLETNHSLKDPRLSSALYKGQGQLQHQDLPLPSFTTKTNKYFNFNNDVEQGELLIDEKPEEPKDNDDNNNINNGNVNGRSLENPKVRNTLWKLVRPRKNLIGCYLCRECKDQLYNDKNKVTSYGNRSLIKFSLCEECTLDNMTFSDKWARDNKSQVKRKFYDPSLFGPSSSSNYNQSGHFKAGSNAQGSSTTLEDGRGQVGRDNLDACARVFRGHEMKYK